MAKEEKIKQSKNRLYWLALSICVFMLLLFIRLYTKYIYTKNLNTIGSLEAQIVENINQVYRLNIEFINLTNPIRLSNLSKKYLPDFNYLSLKKTVEFEQNNENT